MTKYPLRNEIEKKEEGTYLLKFLKICLVISLFMFLYLGEIGSGVHSDYGGITVLHADGPGLYVLRPNQTSAEVLIVSFITHFCLLVFGIFVTLVE